MFLIMSAAYITLELESEFGTIPPLFYLWVIDAYSSIK